MSWESLFDRNSIEDFNCFCLFSQNFSFSFRKQILNLKFFFGGGEGKRNLFRKLINFDVPINKLKQIFLNSSNRFDRESLGREFWNSIETKDIEKNKRPPINYIPQKKWRDILLPLRNESKQLTKTHSQTNSFHFIFDFHSILYLTKRERKSFSCQSKQKIFFGKIRFEVFFLQTNSRTKRNSYDSWPWKRFGCQF